MRNFIVLIASLFLAGCRQAVSTADIPAVKPFSVERYLGVWHEAARLPHRFEAGMLQVRAEYYRDGDGALRVCNQGVRDGKRRKIDGFVRQKKAGCGELEVSFFRPFYGAYRVIAIEEDYSAALVTSSTRDYAWVLVRDPQKSPAILPKYLALLKQWGFDCTKLEYPEK